MAKLSGLSFARLLGEISPKIKTTIVATIVERVAPYSGLSSRKIAVATAVRPIFTRLFPIRIVESRLSYLLYMASTLLALLSPSAARFFILILLMDVKEVSVAEK